MEKICPAGSSTLRNISRTSRHFPEIIGSPPRRPANEFDTPIAMISLFGSAFRFHGSSISIAFTVRRLSRVPTSETIMTNLMKIPV